ncbi:hypothetical protein HPB50_000732 [Hyalomma asiaticum]|uniref:Uncharacterized protein n=1 Tax=Hyalomma asiaticum TaxID=266040 RepID=A0ACB7SS97_HYAAI|nr:hypothetical protein HPB50_000732 [Hyalomma asiaticum]
MRRVSSAPPISRRRSKGGAPKEETPAQQQLCQERGAVLWTPSFSRPAGRPRSRVRWAGWAPGQEQQWPAAVVTCRRSTAHIRVALAHPTRARRQCWQLSFLIVSRRYIYILPRSAPVPREGTERRYIRASPPGPPTPETPSWEMRR